MDDNFRKIYLDLFFHNSTISTRLGLRAAIEAMFLSCTDLLLSTPSSKALAPSDGTLYHRLYSSTHDGLSLSRFIKAILGWHNVLSAK